MHKKKCKCKYYVEGICEDSLEKGTELTEDQGDAKDKKKCF